MAGADAIDGDLFAIGGPGLRGERVIVAFGTIGGQRPRRFGSEPDVVVPDENFGFGVRGWDGAGGFVDAWAAAPDWGGLRNELDFVGIQIEFESFCVEEELDRVCFELEIGDCLVWGDIASIWRAVLHECGKHAPRERISASGS